METHSNTIFWMLTNRFFKSVVDLKVYKFQLREFLRKTNGGLDLKIYTEVNGC